MDKEDKLFLMALAEQVVYAIVNQHPLYLRDMTPHISDLEIFEEKLKAEVRYLEEERKDGK